MKTTRDLYRTLFLAVAVMLAGGADIASAARKPNIVFILADDLRPDCLGVLGHPIVKTPNLDKLVADGFIFRNAYVLGSDSAAVCRPSRMMIQTGQSYLRKNITTPILAQTIKATGYASIRSGKLGNGPKDVGAGRRGARGKPAKAEAGPADDE